MAKKIYDIMPPKVANKVENAIKSLDAKETKKRKTSSKVKAPQKLVRKEARFPLKEFVFGGVVIVLLFGVYFLGKLPWVDVEISPKLDQAELRENVIANISVNEINSQKKVIPLRLLEETREDSQEFPATGMTSNNGKATGIITIYNKVSPATPISLVSGTHFLSDSGKYFITLSKVTIPAMKGKTPGSVNVKVQAKDYGSDYNIEPSKFSVPKLSGTAYYYTVWGESKEKMAGGYTGQVKKVTKDDIDSAKDVLTKGLLEKTESYIRSQISGDEVLLDDALLSKVINTSSDVKPETIVDKFKQSAKVKVSALVFKKTDLESYAKENIISLLTDDKNLLENSLSVTYKADSVDIAKGIEKISFEALAKTYYDIDLDDLADLFRKKSSKDIKEIIYSQYGEKVLNVEVNFWPFWVKSAPKNLDRIKVNLTFE